MQTEAENVDAADGEAKQQQSRDIQGTIQTNFQDLPRELRDRIYDLLVVDTKDLSTASTVSVFVQDAPSAPALLCTSSQVNKEYTERLSKKKKITVHGTANNLLRSTALASKPLAESIAECTVYLSVFIGLGSLAGNIRKFVDSVLVFAQHFPILEKLRLKYASRNLVGYSSLERPPWTLEKALDGLTKEHRVEEVEIWEGNNHIVPCRDCQDLYRALNAGDGGRCQCYACKNFHEVWYRRPDEDATVDDKPRSCNDCGRHNFYRWGVWQKGVGWTYFQKRRAR